MFAAVNPLNCQSKRLNSTLMMGVQIKLNAVDGGRRTRIMFIPVKFLPMLTRTNSCFVRTGLKYTKVAYIPRVFGLPHWYTSPDPA